MEALKNDFDKNYLSLEAKLKKIEKGTYEVGDVVKYHNFDWYVINVLETSNNSQTLKLLLKDKLSKEILDTLNFAHDSYGDIKFNNTLNNDWTESNVRKCVIAFANEYLNVSDLMEMKTNYDEDKTSYDCIRLLTIREAEKLPKEIRKVAADSGYWTMTPSYKPTDQENYASVFYVSTSGNLNAYRVYDTRGLRPVITLSTDELL